MKQRESIIRRISQNRSDIFELLIIGIILATGVNILSEAVPSFFEFCLSQKIWIGSILTLIAIGYVALKLFTRRAQIQKYQAVILYDSEENSLVHIPRYKFSEDLLHYIRGGFTENRALEEVWKKQPLSLIPELVWGKKKDEKKYPESMRIISEAVEYFILDRLSVHLSGYFSDDNFKQKNLQNYQRNDIPDILLSNRFLELFSKPMKDRPAFVQYSWTNEKPISMWKEDGTIYSRFELVLPQKTTIKRPTPTTFEIDTNRLIIGIDTGFDGLSANLPRGFAKYYLGITDSENESFFQRYQCFQINVTVTVKFRFYALLLSSGWEYHYWINDFLNELETLIEVDEFISSINWETAYTLLMLINHSRDLS